MGEPLTPQEINGGPLDNAAPRFGEWFTGVYASEDNPHRHGMFVRVVRRVGRLNPGIFYQLTDGDGAFWLYPHASCTRKAVNES